MHIPFPLHDSLKMFTLISGSAISKRRHKCDDGMWSQTMTM